MSATAEGAIVGIDLGTTYSVISWMNDEGKIEIIPNTDGYSTTPSVVFFDGDTILVGREAARAALLEPELAAECFKRDLGNDFFKKHINENQFRPEVLSSFVLKKLKQDAEDKIGPISEAVVTVPAYFDDARRKATMDAGKIANLNIKAILNEPQSAALWFAFNHQDSVTPGAIILVYDLGGGTFDATLMRILGDNKFETIATDGDVMLGGKDWDKRLLDYVAVEFTKQAGADPREDDVTYEELAMRIEESKRALSKRSSVNIPVSYNGQNIRIPVTREKFKELTIDLLNRTQTTVELLLDEVDLEWNNISSILLTGGSSRMEMVSEMLSNISGKQIDKSLDADLAVAQGAAVYAAALKAKESSSTCFAKELNDQLVAMEHTNVNSHSLGVEVENEQTGAAENFIIINRNTALPCCYKASFGLSAPSTSNSKIDVKILEGEAKHPEACIHIGTCTIDDIPEGLPLGSPVEVSFSYSEDGRIHVTAEATDVGIEAHTHIVREHGISDDDIQQEQSSVLGLTVV